MKKEKSYDFVYRNILIEVRQGYAHPRIKRMSVVVHTPDIERYFKNTSGVRRFVDKFLHYHDFKNDFNF